MFSKFEYFKDARLLSVIVESVMLQKAWANLDLQTVNCQYQLLHFVCSASCL